MALFRKVGAAAAAVLLVAGMAGAQDNPRAYVGNEDLGINDMNSGGAPETAVISGLTDIEDYAFDGSDLSIDFTLDGTQTGSATVWLIIYTTGAHPALTIEGEGPRPDETDGVDNDWGAAGWHVYEDVDLLVFNSAGEQFSAGANTITWDGRDNDGNIVESGSYDLFLAAFDADARAHIVGYAPGRGGSQHMLIVDPDAGTLTRPFRWTVDMNNDFITNSSAATFIDRSEIQAESPLTNEVSETTDTYWWQDTPQPNNFNIVDMIPLGTSGDITADTESWIGYGPGISGTVYLTKGSYDSSTNIATVDTDFGADNDGVNGFIDYTERQGQRKYGIAVNPEGTWAYTTNGVDATDGSFIVWDVATGAFVDKWTTPNDIFMYRGGTRVAGPSWIGRDYTGKSDPTGITTSGHHTSVIGSFDYETGNVRWLNRNGDHFADMYANNPTGPPADGSDWVHGHPDGAGAKYGMNSTKWGWTSITHTAVNFTDYGSVLGGDGSGLFRFQPTNIPSTIQWWSMIVDHDDSDWDGLYISIGEDDNGTRSNDWAPEATDEAPVNPYSYHWFAQLPYDQKRVSLGEPMTAVAELGGATPDVAELGDAYPNPFNPETTIRFNLPWEAPVKVDVFNEQGQLVTTLIDDQMGPGNFTVTWDGRDANGSQVASGMYIYKIKSGDLNMSKKVTFLK